MAPAIFRPAAYTVLALLCGAVCWSYWRIVMTMFAAWQRSDDYSAGQLVPLVALFFVWHKRDVLRRCSLKPCWGWGLALMGIAEVIRLLGFLSGRGSIERYSLPVMVAGLVLLIVGRQVFARTKWILAYLFLMVPLPEFINDRISLPLRNMATQGSIFLLEAFGIQADRQGNVVLLNGEVTLGVAEACSGLRMLTAFVVVSGFVAFMVRRSWKVKLFLFFSCIPMAVVCNIIRIFLTAIMMVYVSEELGAKFFHDFAGLVMMPAAVSLLFGELWVIDKLLDTEAARPPESRIVRKKPAE